MLTDYQKERYQRQLILKDFGEIGQQKLLASKVLVVGLGGLGSVVSLYLTAAGIGVVGIMDKDTVSLHNLQRQILYRENEIGTDKLGIAYQSLSTLNHQVKLVPYNTFLTKDNAYKIIQDYDIVIDATDNFSTRYLINDTCIELNKPFVYASIGDYTGQMCVFNYKPPAANYRTLFPDEQQLLKRGNINKGVMGILPCTLACLQVNEVIKMITGTGQVMKDTLFTIDLLTLETHKFKLPVKPQEGNN